MNNPSIYTGTIATEITHCLKLVFFTYFNSLKTAKNITTDNILYPHTFIVTSVLLAPTSSVFNSSSIVIIFCVNII